jgi:hypothetical protein
MKKLLLLLSIVALISSCNKKEDDDDDDDGGGVVNTPTEKELFSNHWEIGNGAWYYDLSVGSLGNNFVAHLYYAGGYVCECATARFTGTQSSGSYVMPVCTLSVDPAPGNTNPTICDTLETAAGTYTNSGGTLILTRFSTPLSYQ